MSNGGGASVGGYWRTGVAGDSLAPEESSGKRDLSETGTLEDWVGLIVELCAKVSGANRPCDSPSSTGSLNPEILLTVSNCHPSDNDVRWSGLRETRVIPLTEADEGERTHSLRLPNRVGRQGWSLYHLLRSKRHIEEVILSG